MIAIELKKILKEGMVILFVLIGLMTAMMTTGKVSYLAPILEIFLLLYASFTGWSMFDRERQEGAVEYMLSLPISRTRLLLLKLIPRLFAVCVVLLIFSFVQKQFADDFLLTSFWGFTLFYLTVFLLSFTLSLSMKSFLGTFFLVLIFSAGLYFFIAYLDPGLDRFSITLQAALSLLVVPVSFFILIQKFDIKPAFYFNLKFIPILAGVLFLMFGGTYLFTKVTFQNCFLTAQGFQLWTSSKRTVFVKSEKSRKVFKRFLFPLYESNNEIYAIARGKSWGNETLIRLNTNTGTFETVLKIEPGWWFHSIYDSGVALGNRVYFLLTYGRDHQEYKILEVEGLRTKILPLYGDFGNSAIHSLDTVTGNPLQFIVHTDDRVYRVLEDGQVDSLFAASAVHAWKDRFLVFNKQGMTLYEIGDSLRQVFQKSGKARKIKRRRQDTMKKQTLVKVGGDFFLLDMESLKFEQVPLKRIPYSYTADEDGMRFVDVDKSEISVFNWNEGRLRPEKTWFSELNPDTFRLIRVFSTGVTIANNKGCEIFLYDKREGGDR